MICALCKEERDLRLSHIIPEYLFKTAYDEKHRAVEINLKPPNQISYLQKGYREKLLCEKCEQFLNSNYEIYFINLWYEKSYQLKNNNKETNYLFPKLEMSKISLFLFLVVVVGSISMIR